MSSLIRAVKFSAGVLMAAAFLVALPAKSYAENGTVRAKIVKAGFIVGVGGGSGTLSFKGKTYRLSIGGVSVGTLGVAAVDIVGTARNLRRASDIAGAYSAVGAGVAVIGGGKVAHLQNANGVVLDVRGVQVGLDLSLNLSGMTISLQ